jgi:hypothetical protein
MMQLFGMIAVGVEWVMERDPGKRRRRLVEL